MKTLNFKKALAFTVLTLTPALAFTSSAQADPAFRAPVSQRGHDASAWNDNSRYQAPRFDSRSNQSQNFDSRSDRGRDQNQRGDERFAPRREENRLDQRRNDQRRHNDNDSSKIIGAGIVGAILGAVLSR